MTLLVVMLGVVLAGLVGLIVTLVVVNARDERSRRRRLSGLAMREGWTYQVNADRRVVSRYIGDPFARYGGGDVPDLVTGTHRGRRFLAFQYGYLRQTSQGRVRRSLSHVAVPLPGVGPRVTIKQQDLASRMSEGFGGRRFILGVPAFDLRFDVRGDDDAFIRALFGRDLAPWLLSLPNARPLTVEHAELRTWTDGRLSDTVILGLADYLCTALERVPADLWRPPDGAGDRG